MEKIGSPTKLLCFLALSGGISYCLHRLYIQWRQNQPNFIQQDIKFEDFISYWFPQFGFRNYEQLRMELARSKINYNSIDAYGGNTHPKAIFNEEITELLTTDCIIEQIQKYKGFFGDTNRQNFVIFTVQQIPNITTFNRIIFHNRSNHILQIRSRKYSNIDDCNHTVYIQT